MENIYMTQKELINYLNLPSGNDNIYKLLDTDLEVPNCPCWTLIFIKDNKLYDVMFCHYDNEAIVECSFKRLLKPVIKNTFYKRTITGKCKLCRNDIHVVNNKITCSKINEQYSNIQLLKCGCKKVCNMALYNIFTNECNYCKLCNTKGWNCEEIRKDNYDGWDEYLAPYYKD